MAIPTSLRSYGSAPFSIALIHGGPGAGGEMAPVARVLSAGGRGVLEPMQTARSLDGQVEELRAVLEEHADLPATLIGFSWGAWLSFIVAARHPALARKLILVGSGPFEARYVSQLRETRLARLRAEEREEWRFTSQALEAPATPDRDALLECLGRLTRKTDAYDPLPADADEADRIGLQGDVYHEVWRAAAELRRSGELLRLGERVACPVVAIHGDHDPHPAEGVREPLTGVLKDFRFIVIERCGHTPWIERQARDAFYAALQDHLE
jgi:pimeloyl-ACP methyl ester carboxylesterase